MGLAEKIGAWFGEEKNQKDDLVEGPGGVMEHTDQLREMRENEDRNNP